MLCIVTAVVSLKFGYVDVFVLSTHQISPSTRLLQLMSPLIVSMLVVQCLERGDRTIESVAKRFTACRDVLIICVAISFYYLASQIVANIYSYQNFGFRNALGMCGLGVIAFAFVDPIVAVCVPIFIVFISQLFGLLNFGAARWWAFLLDENMDGSTWTTAIVLFAAGMLVHVIRYDGYKLKRSVAKVFKLQRNF